MKLNFSINPKDFSENGTAELESFSDSDLGADASKRSTSGGLGMFKGKFTKALIIAYCKRQGSVSLSTPEAELVAVTVLAKKILSIHMTAQRLLKVAISLTVLEDNSAAEKVCGTGISASMSYLKRTVSLSLAWCKQNLRKIIGRIESNRNPSDLFTKPLEKESFERYREHLGIW